VIHFTQSEAEAVKHNSMSEIEGISCSAELGELFAALALAQGELGNAIKDSNNPAFKSKYADLAACWEAWQPCGPKQGLGVLQPARGLCDDGKVRVVTILGHKSGQFVACTTATPASKSDAHGVGSATTYGRRNGFTAMVGISPDDDDGNAAVQRGSKADASTQEPTPNAAPANGAPAKEESCAAAAALDWAERFIAKAQDEKDSKQLADMQHRQKNKLATMRAKYPEYADRIAKACAEHLEKIDPLDDSIPF